MIELKKHLTHFLKTEFAKTAAKRRLLFTACGFLTKNDRSSMSTTRKQASNAKWNNGRCPAPVPPEKNKEVL